MKICIVLRRASSSSPEIELARGLSDAGHRVHLLIAPGPGDPASPGDPGPIDGVILHRLPAPVGGGFLTRRPSRRAALSRVLRAIDPQVVHLADEADRGLAVPDGPVVLQSVSNGPPTSGADAALIPDGRFLDHAGLPFACPGVPPSPSSSSASTVAEGIDPGLAASHWRVLTYVSAVNQIRRSRRVRLDRSPGAASPFRRLASLRPAAPAAVPR